MRRFLIWVTVFGFLCLSAPGGHGQLKKLLKKIPSGIPSLTDILESEPSLTTSIADAATEVPFLDYFNPERALPMTDLPRTPEGGFVLNRPGFFIFDCQSYCLKAGTYAPDENRGGTGYLYAPLKGPRAEIVRHVLHGSYIHPEIPQRDIQVLLWAIIARTKISDMYRAMQLTAAQLLTKEEILSLEGGALGIASDALMSEAFLDLPPLIRQTLEAEARLRSLLTQAGTTYEELERVAVLHGDPPSHAEDRAVTWGRWSFHPDGYFIRYFPSSYTQTQIELYVPEAIQVERDTQGRITSISDELGNRIETDYDDTGEVLTDPGHPGMRGFAFSSIRIIQRNMLHPEKVLENRTEWINSGWTLVGDPSEGPATTIPSNPAFNYLERLTASRKHSDELTGLLAGLEITGDLPEAPQQSQSQREELVNLAHFAQAISEAAQKNDTQWRGRTIDSLELVKKAWMAAVSRTLCTHTGTLTFDPASDPVPGKAASQRLGDSGRPAENNECDNLENAIKNAIDWLERHAAESCTQAQNTEEAEKNVDEGADFEVDAGVRMDNCELVVNGKSGVSFQEFKDYLMKNGHSSAVADAIVLHEREHMRQCYNQDGQEGRPDFANPTPEDFCKNEVEAYCVELKSLLNSMNAAGCQPNPELAAKITQALSKCK